ncbi:hypothetical protein BC831DRAFT_443273 [Entophlyctis helioformis]|nr:hypothetical protein BC831DRAFT_443273 [Entophlyctis helioformis]
MLARTASHSASLRRSLRRSLLSVLLLLPPLSHAASHLPAPAAAPRQISSLCSPPGHQPTSCAPGRFLQFPRFAPTCSMSSSPAPTTMRAVVVTKPGDAAFMEIGQVPTPVPKANELLVRVKCFALNRMDILQRNGLYPPPAGASDILGVEFAGDVVHAPASSSFKTGDRVFGLVPGGAYAEYAVIHQDMAIAIPAGMPYEHATAIPEAWFTAFQALFLVNRLQPGEDVLIHAGASGVGTAAIQLAKHNKSRHVIATAGSDDKVKFCESLGSTAAVNYKTHSFAQRVSEITGGRGVDVIVDFVGAQYWTMNLDSLAMDGRMVMLAFLGGAQLQSSNLAPILRKRLQINGSTLRSRTVDYQIALRNEFVAKCLPGFADGTFKPVIDRVFDSWTGISDAHRHMESNASIGKILVRVPE